MEATEDPAAVPWKQASFNFYDKRILGSAWEQEARPAVLKEFFRVLAVCHTVIPDGTNLCSLLLLPSLLVMHACHDILYLCTHRKLAYGDTCNGLYLCSGDRLGLL